MSRPTEPMESRFARLVDRTGECWEWIGPTDKNGYGRIVPRRGITLKAHRMAWERAIGPIPAGLCVLHRCDNPPCVRPDHLFLGTQADNLRDCYAKGRMRPYFVEQPRSKLTPAQRQSVAARKRMGESRTDLAAEFGITPQYVTYLAARQAVPA